VIRSRVGDSMKDYRDLALILVGRDLLARSSELVNLEVAAVEFETEGASVALRRIKTSTETKAHWIGPEAAEALRVWLMRADITVGTIFRSLTKSGRVTERALDTRDVHRSLKSRAVAARLKHGAKVSGHSLRVGMAQDLAGANTDLAGIMQAGSWKSVAMVARYTERVAAKRGAVARFYANRQGI